MRSPRGCIHACKPHTCLHGLPVDGLPPLAPHPPGAPPDTTVLGRVLERGLAADGRLNRFVVAVSDRPGGIAKLTNLVFQCGASIKDLYHERAWLLSDVASVQLRCVVETRSREHGDELRAALEKEYKVVWNDQLPEHALNNDSRPTHH